MMNYISNILEFILDLIDSCPFGLSIIIGILIIILESIIPALPLGVFIALNMVALGNILGFMVSWLATSLGCLLSFLLVRKCLHKRFEDKTKKNVMLFKFKRKVKRLSFSQFVIITALPFTPAFAINIAAGLTNMNTKRFIIGILISKIFVVYFWGFIGTTFIQSITDLVVIFKLVTMLVIAYILSKLIMKKYKLD